MSNAGAQSSKLVSSLEQLGVHEHLCLIYETPEEQFSAVVPFIRIGLARNEKCVYIADDNIAADVIEAMRSGGIDVDAALESGSLTVFTKQEAYLREGSFDPDRMILFLQQAVEEATAGGYAALRVTGEMTWALGPDIAAGRLMEYEAKLNYFIPHNAVVAVCQYNRRRFSPEVIRDVIRTHPVVIYGATVCRNFYFVPPDEFLTADRTPREVERLLGNILARNAAEDDLRRSEQRIKEGRDRLLEQLKTLTALTRSEVFARGDMESALRHLLEVDARQMGTERVSLWRFTEDRSAIACVDLYELGADRHTSGAELKARDYPSYFAALETEEAIVADDARGHPATHEFSNAYLDQVGITSMLDVPIHLYGRVEGVLCHEHVGPPLSWLPEQRLFAISIASLISLASEQHERRKAEERLRESEQFVKRILETVDEGFIVIDPQYRIISANKAYGELIGVSAGELRGRHCYEVSHQSSRPCHEVGEDCPVRRAFDDGESHFAVHRHRDRAGNTVIAETRAYPMKDASGAVLSVIEIVNNVSEKVRLAEQLRHAQKMEAVGTLAGGIAHDFNNMLNVIIGYAGMMEMAIGHDEPLAPYVREVLQAAERAARLTQGLLAFSRKQVMEFKTVDLNEIVTGMKKMLFGVIGEDVEQRLDLAPQVLSVTADRGQIEQVLLNLVTNARDAMPDGGLLSVATASALIDDDFINMHGYGRKGRYARITVSDTGMGMDALTRERIFEPFFTTKEVGRGTGLGLSIVYGIMKQHRGYIACYSEPGKGTTFAAYLPLAGQDPEKRQAPLITPERGTETVLLAEDSDVLRKLTSEVLSAFGYSVIEARDGQEAVEQFRAHGEKISLLLFDVVMPRKSGWEAYEEIRAMRPGIRALFVSGYSSEVVARKGMFNEGVNIIFKPVSPNTLLAKVREVLG